MELNSFCKKLNCSMRIIIIKIQYPDNDNFENLDKIEFRMNYEKAKQI